MVETSGVRIVVTGTGRGVERPPALEYLPVIDVGVLGWLTARVRESLRT